MVKVPFLQLILSQILVEQSQFVMPDVENAAESIMAPATCLSTNRDYHCRDRGHICMHDCRILAFFGASL